MNSLPLPKFRPTPVQPPLNAATRFPTRGGPGIRTALGSGQHRGRGFRGRRPPSVRGLARPGPTPLLSGSCWTPLPPRQPTNAGPTAPGWVVSALHLSAPSQPRSESHHHGHRSAKWNKQPEKKHAVSPAFCFFIFLEQAFAGHRGVHWLPFC